MPSDRRDQPRINAAYREARIQSYAQTRSVQSLAQMIVELEDAGGHCPEFEIDEEWPRCVDHLRPR